MQAIKQWREEPWREEVSWGELFLHYIKNPYDPMTRKFILLFLVATVGVNAQFAAPAGMPGSTAIYKDSSCFVAWANHCDIERGWIDLSDTSAGRATVGSSLSAIGKAGENGVVSLGDGGRAQLQFQNLIYNGPGYDFAVFENSFRDDFLELAFVEVSSDGLNYRRFPATSLIDTSIQVDSFGLIDCRQVNNLAGKYRALYGTPFDLNELAIYSDIDIMNISSIRLVDVVGSMDNRYATRDQDGRKINDPFPTPYPSSGFDLDAVGVIHSRGLNAIEAQTDEKAVICGTLHHPGEKISLNIHGKADNAELIDMTGIRWELQMENDCIEIAAPISSGVYLLKISTKDRWFTQKIVIE